MNNRLEETQNSITDTAPSTLAAIQARAIHTQTFQECVRSKDSSDLTALHIARMIQRTDTQEMVAAGGVR
jgi:hypothetical protein